MRRLTLISTHNIGGKKVKKISLILALALVLVVAFAASAYADYTNFYGGYNVSANGVTTGQSTNWGGGASSIQNRSALNINPTTGGWGQTTNPTAVYLPGNPSQQPVHSDYQANTDACAACHAVHTGNGDALTQWNTAGLAGITNVCMACHDGTVTKTYNVIAGTFAASDTGATEPNNGGLFAVVYEGNTNSASEHNVFAGLLTSAAYGGANPNDIVQTNVTTTTDTAGNTTAVADSHGNWDIDFDCTACHTPHGQGGNARILNPNPNYVMTNGQAPAKGTTTTTETAALSAAASYALSGRPILGYPYGFTVKVGTTSLAEYQDYTISLDPTSGNAVINFKNPQTGALTVSYTAALAVRMNVANKLTSAEAVTYESGINKFCGACHTDYNTENVTDPAGTLNGTYSSHTRHLVGMTASSSARQARGLKFQYPVGSSNPAAASGGQVTCLTCHYAHGTDQSRWQATANSSGISAYNSSELAGSSRLKRLPNMGVCEACHEKGTGAFSGGFNGQTAF